MKNTKNVLAALPILLFTLFACHKSDDNSPGTTVTPSAGQWKITYFFDKLDETAHYTGYVFDFGTNGSLTATNGAQTWSGNWQTGIDDSSNKIQFNFTGTIPSELSDLVEDWQIITMEDTFMHFEHTSGGNGDTDVVKFTKN